MSRTPATSLHPTPPQEEELPELEEFFPSDGASGAPPIWGRAGRSRVTRAAFTACALLVMVIATASLRASAQQSNKIGVAGVVSVAESGPNDRKRAPSLFCFSAMLPDSPEEALIKAQFERNLSIFACDEFAVLSSEKRLLGRHGHREIFTDVVWEPMTCKKGHIGVDGAETNGYLNAKFFMVVWDTLIISGRPWLHDFTIKVDPDAVFFPDRVVGHVGAFVGRPVFVLNCNRWSSPRLYGSLEIFSKQALQMYDAGWRNCTKHLNWRGWGEDQYMQECMNLLHVPSHGDFNLVADGSCNGGACTDWYRVAFHGFKSVDTYMQCIQWAVPGMYK